MSTSGRRSFKWTSAARTMRLSLIEWAIALIVRMLHGATSIPAVRKLPLAMAAARSFSSYCTWARASTSETFHSVSYSIVARAPLETIAWISIDGSARSALRDRMP